MSALQAAKAINELPASTVPDWIKGIVLALEDRELAEKALSSYLTVMEKRGHAVQTL